jgi:hypothetical protein
VAYWNLAHRPLAIDERGRFTAGGSELAFFHFSGVDPHDPALLSKHQTRFTEDDLGPFRPAYRKYLQALLDNGYERISKIPYAFGVTKYGAPIVPEMRQVFRHRYDANGPHPAADPFNLGPQAFALPTDQLPKASPRISLLLFEAWKRRDLLKDSFDVYSRDGREGLLAWYASVGERVVGVGKEFVEGDRMRLAAYSRSKERQSADRANSAWLPALWGLRRAVAWRACGRSTLERAPGCAASLPHSNTHASPPLPVAHIGNAALEPARVRGTFAGKRRPLPASTDPTPRSSHRRMRRALPRPPWKRSCPLVNFDGTCWIGAAIIASTSIFPLARAIP